MNEGEYLELCNQLKERYEEFEQKENDRKREVFRLKRSMLFYISMINAVRMEIEQTGLMVPGTVQALLDVVTFRGNEDLENILHYEEEEITSTPNTPILIMGFNQVRVEGETTREPSENGN